MAREVKQGEFYRHFKDRLYQILTVAEHSETGEKLVVYQALYGDYRVYARPYEMFVSEVDHEKYPDVEQKYRFERVEFTGESQTIVEKPVSDSEINPLLLEFLDAERLEDKMHILACHRNQMDDSLLNNIAISLDLVVEKKDLQEKYDEIMKCLATKDRFECNRLR